MVTMRERWGRDWRLNWRAILAGGVLAIGAAWAGELLGGLLSLIEPGESSAWGWLGGILALGMTLAGAFAGGWIAARAAGADERSNGLLHGLVAWGVFATASALLFAVLGAHHQGAVRLALGFAMLGQLGALLAAAAGGIAAAGTRPGAGLGLRRPARPAAPATGAERPAPDLRAGEGEHEAPPSVH